jgi:predicted RNA-binding protein with PIN domain
VPVQSNPVRKPRERQAQRQPIAIPGGVYGDSVAAAAHLLRTNHVNVIVDGYNVAKLAWPHLELADQRECCIELLEDVVRRFGTDIHVVFDGASIVGAAARRRLVRVNFSPSGVSADDVIRAEVAGLPAQIPVVVVTNDQAIINDVRTMGANTVRSDVLLSAVGRNAPR